MGWQLIGIEVNESFLNFTKRGVTFHVVIKKIFDMYGLEQGWDYHVSQSERKGQEFYTVVLPRRYALHFKACFHDLLIRAFDTLEREELVAQYESRYWMLHRSKRELEQECIRELGEGNLQTLVPESDLVTIGV